MAWCFTPESEYEAGKGMAAVQSDVKAGADLVGPPGALSDIFLGSKSPLNAMVKRPKPDSQ